MAWITQRFEQTTGVFVKTFGLMLKEHWFYDRLAIGDIRYGLWSIEYPATMQHNNEDTQTQPRSKSGVLFGSSVNDLDTCKTFKVEQSKTDVWCLTWNFPPQTMSPLTPPSSSGPISSTLMDPDGLVDVQLLRVTTSVDHPFSS